MNDMKNNANRQQQQQAAQQRQIGTSQPTTQSKAKKGSALNKKLLFTVLVLILLIGGGLLAWKYLLGGSGGIKTGQYQAVFLQNGQVYFGKMQNSSGEYVLLEDVYYLQVQPSEEGDDEESQTQQLQQGEPQLIKLGEELHGPEDEMRILQSHVAFWENMKDDSRVVEAINEFQESDD